MSNTKQLLAEASELDAQADQMIASANFFKGKAEGIRSVLSQPEGNNGEEKKEKGKSRSSGAGSKGHPT